MASGNLAVPEHWLGRWQTTLPSGKLRCDLCPRECELADGQRAFCFVRQRQGEQIVLSSYGASTGFVVDPIEKKPLSHFYPGTSVLSFGSAGCNLGCRFCQNWDISKAREVERLSAQARPEDIARAARDAGCKSVAFTYNDPVIFAEFAIDTAHACRELGLQPVAVTAGYIGASARAEFFQAMSAVNVDLKAFTQEFYKKLCFANMQPVLETLEFLAHESDVWLEITTLLIPGENDSPEEVERLCTFIHDRLGPNIPLHFSAFHPDFKLTQHPPTPPETVLRARRQALSVGLRHVYGGNIDDRESQTTYCPDCQTPVIERDRYRLSAYRLSAAGDCESCGARMTGRFDTPGDWGNQRRRLVVA